MRRASSNLELPKLPRWKSILAALGFGALLLVVYGPALKGDFIWDDDAYVTHNPLLTADDGWQRIWFSAHRQSQFFPLVYSVLRLEFALWGLNPAGYHVVNVLLHALNALLVWRVLKQLGLPGAALAGALFALHPVQVESVAWITELKNTLSTLFLLLALLAWIRFLRGRPGAGLFYALALCSYVLALLSKTTACTLVAALVLIPWMQGQRISIVRCLQVLPFVALGVAAGLTSIWWESHLGNYTQDVGQHLTLLERLLVASRALWFYAFKLVWPFNLAFSYPKWDVSSTDPWDYLPLLACIAAAVGLWYGRKNISRPIVAGILFFAATLAPLLGFVPLYTFLYTYVADHYQYVACIGLLAVLAAGLCRLPWGAPFILLAGLAFLTWKQAHIYRDQVALWQDTLKRNPASWMAHNNIGMAYNERGEIDRALTHYGDAIRLKPDFAPARYNRGIVLFKRGDVAEAMAEFTEAVRVAPRDPRAAYNLALALDGQDRLSEAAEHYQRAIGLQADYVEAHVNLGIVLSRLGKIDEAEDAFQEAVRLEPNHVEARNNLGAVLRARGQRAEAERHLREAIKLAPNHALARANLGGVLLDAGQLQEAVVQLQEAIRLEPRSVQAGHDLRRALEAIERAESR
jgi:tetratricopeptide (TPR) repeat protein